MRVTNSPEPRPAELRMSRGRRARCQRQRGRDRRVGAAHMGAFGRIDSLINNAGVIGSLGSSHCMNKINISSIAGLNPGQLPGSPGYAASKAGVDALSKVMAIELAMYNIRVNSINLELFKSEITEGLMQKDWLSKVALRTVPMRTFDVTCVPIFSSVTIFRQRFTTWSCSSWFYHEILLED
ncbi:hypothetical protein RJ639_032664 [Escallonia herrerae]|uniref:Uncharacterized protein n=1 Tax=Escallonia herrerae TaxID=1293975 RepID=A0AA89BK49_9ASTE|nr:hypothetical protein RJ639_032664 [Escallonia herrerae]